MKRITLALLLIICSMLLSGCKDLVRIQGHSMEPTLHTDDIVRTVPYDSPEDVTRFDIIILNSPTIGYLTAKRVIGLPGDQLEIRDGVVYLNSERQNEPYVASENRMNEDYGPVTVPDGHIFVLGDNRSNSRDSRDKAFGMIPFDLVVSKVTEFVNIAVTPVP